MIKRTGDLVFYVEKTPPLSVLNGHANLYKAILKDNFNPQNHKILVYPKNDLTLMSIGMSIMGDSKKEKCEVKHYILGKDVEEITADNAKNKLTPEDVIKITKNTVIQEWDNIKNKSQMDFEEDFKNKYDISRSEAKLGTLLMLN